MEKKTKYWIAGIAALVVLALLLWYLLYQRQGTQNNTSMDHQDHTSSLGQTTEEDSQQGTGQEEDLDDYLDDQDDIMAKMMEEMQDIPHSGQAAVDFLRGMIPHHDSAVAMAESYLKYGGANKELAALAQDIIQVQKEEINQMNAMIKDLEASGTEDAAQAQAYLDEYNEMFGSSHAHHIDSSGMKSVDQAFAQGMILHHQMAVDMAEAVLPYTDSSDVKELAENIIRVQKKEIKQMQDILNIL